MELDKFKRRLVRSVSRLMKQDKSAQEAAWEQLQKETTCDCKLLCAASPERKAAALAARYTTDALCAVRMRGLTVKKLKRLAQVDDRNDAVPAVVRMSPTDWLLFDLVLAHEKVDVIGRDQIGRGKGQMERPIMTELFDLVLEYDIELKRGDQLLEAWAALTREYNSSASNRHCSPMLLQKRWFQLKEATRANFYKLWNSYRGKQQLWDVAQLSKPTPLQAEIAKKFPHVITQAFPEWEELIQLQKVIVLEQFETYSRIRKEGAKTADDKPDLVVIEPVIETIDLGAESDGEGPPPPPTGLQVNLALVKQEPAGDCLEVTQEPAEDGLSNVQILETTHIPPELNEDSNSNSRLKLALEEGNRENLTMQLSKFTESSTIEEDTQVSESAAPLDATDFDDLSDDLIKQKADEYIRSKIKSIELETKKASNEADKDDDKSDDVVDDIIKQKADDFVRKVDMQKLVHGVVDEFELPEELTFEDEGIEFVDDGIEYNEEDDSDTADKEIKEVPDSVVKTEAEADEENKEKVKQGENISEVKQNDVGPKVKEEDSPKFDLKLLMEPVVYTTKLDDMIVFKGKKFNFVQFQNVIDSVVIESKPVSKKAIKVEAEEDRDDTNSQSNLSQSSKTTSDLIKNDAISVSHLNETSNLSQSSKSASEDLFKNDDESQLYENKDTITNDDMFKTNTDAVKNEPLMNISDHYNDESDESEEEIDESLKVKATSCLLQKPRNRSYNPIILCKNPDFNTRLKRLTAGFFCIVRNRKLLSACKPMTIDLNKAFESKLVDGTLYLKSCEGAPQPVREETDNAQSTSVIPSAMPCQSLLSKEKTNINIDDLLSSSHLDTVDLTQRSKTINLRDLSEIRRINQHLLTAQVPPMRVGGSVDVSQSPTYQPQQDLTQETVEDTAPKSTDDSEELKIIGVAGGQNVTPHTLAPEHDFREGLLFDKTPRTYRGRGRGAMRGVRKYGPAKPYVAPYTSTMPCTAPWLTGPKPKPANIDDFLITIDTLNRMINKLDGCAEYQNTKGKHKRPIWAIEKSLRESLDNPVESIKPSTNDAATTTEAKAKDAAPIVEVPEAAVNVSVQTTNIEPKQSPKCVAKRKKRRNGKYCCWSKEKMSKYGSNTRMVTTHKCPTLCQCCCREDLLDEMKRRRLYNNRIKKQQTKRLDDTIVLSDEDCDAGTDDSNDVRIPGFDPVDDTQHALPVPKLRVSSQNQGKVRRYTARGVPMSLAGVSAMQPIQPRNAPAPSTDPQQPVMRINISYAPGPAAPDPPPLAVINSGEGFSSTSKSILEQYAVNTTSVIPTPILALNSSPNRVNIPVALQQSTKTTQRQLVIDASRPVTAENAQDRMFYLNSKAISSKPKDSPIFLGKNKILLTTVKFPSNFNSEETDSVEPIQPSKVMPTTLPLPRGVNLILMPDGHINFTLDPDVHLDSAQLEVIPKIISAVQQQIRSQIVPTAENATLETTSAMNTIVSPGVIDLEGGVDQPVVLENQTTLAVPSIEYLMCTENMNEQTDSINQVDVNNVGEESIKNSDKSEVPTEVESPLVDTNAANDVDKVKDSENNDSDKADENKGEKCIKNTETSVIHTEVESPLVDRRSTNDVDQVKDSEIIPIDKSKDLNEENANKIGEELNKNTEKSEEHTEVESELVDTNSTKDVDKVKDSEIITIEDNNDSEQTNTSTVNTVINNTVNEGASCSRNLLSDLMEMSGISSEDVPQESAEKTQVAIPEVENTVIPLAPLPLVETTANAITEIVPSPTGPVDIPKTLPELSPITSLAELKYACQNNGLFYKLDLDTGVLAPINVCIKKSVKPKPRVFCYANKRPVPLKSVIDLTDDGEIQTAKNVSEDGTVKPIKLVKRVIYQPPNLLMRKTITKRKLTNAHNMNQEHLRKRKQNLEKIEARIDLVDSDAPMEEEYLVDSSDSDTEDKRPNTKRTENITIPDTDADDSSDDEPLSKKFMRLKQTYPSHTQNKDENSDTSKKIADPEERETTETVTEDAPSVSDAPSNVPASIGPAKPNDLDSKNTTDSVNPEQMDICDNDNANDNIDPDDMGMEIEEAQFIPLLDENESQEEDCILGV